MKEDENHKLVNIKWREVIDLWKNSNKDFMNFFIDTLTNKDIFEEYFLWFIPKIGNNDFEFAFKKTDFSKYKTNGESFLNEQTEEILTTNGNVINFPTWSGKTMLVVPTNVNLHDDRYKHIAIFSKLAPIEHQYKFWKHIAEQIIIYDKKNTKKCSSKLLDLYNCEIILLCECEEHEAKYREQYFKDNIKCVNIRNMVFDKKEFMKQYNKTDKVKQYNKSLKMKHYKKQWYQKNKDKTIERTLDNKLFTSNKVCNGCYDFINMLNSY